MLHHFLATFKINGEESPKMEMTYDDSEIIATLKRRLSTAFPTATNIQFTRVSDPQGEIKTGPKRS